MLGDRRGDSTELDVKSILDDLDTHRRVPDIVKSDRTDTSAAVQPLEDVGVLFRANWPAIFVDDNQAGALIVRAESEPFRRLRTLEHLQRGHDRRVQGAGAATSRGLRCGVDPTATATTARPSFPSPTF